MIEIGLFDNNFEHHGETESLSSFPGFNRYPKHFKYRRNVECDINLLTDNCLTLHTPPKGGNIAWLLEPREVSPLSYHVIENSEQMYDLVLTHDRDLLKKLGSKGRFYPYLGTWIADKDFNIYNKDHSLSIIYSWKKQTYGHKLRHAIADAFASKYQIEKFGSAAHTLPQSQKILGLKHYRYSIVVENTWDSIISEKIVDCFLTGTVPIYWGERESIAKFFNPSGVLFFNDLASLEKILQDIEKNDVKLYERMLSDIQMNFDLATKNHVCEDWIWENILKDWVNDRGINND